MEKGFTTIEKTRGLAGVNCQNCHRFDMKEHWVKGFQRPPVTESVCASCHSPITDPKFANQFAQKLAKIRCPRKPVK
jgi:DNA-directed RNA polymerase subunit RPC12/RpoP